MYLPLETSVCLTRGLSNSAAPLLGHILIRFPCLCSGNLAPGAAFCHSYERSWNWICRYVCCMSKLPACSRLDLPLKDLIPCSVWSLCVFALSSSKTHMCFVGWVASIAVAVPCCGGCYLLDLALLLGTDCCSSLRSQGSG